MRRAVLLVLVGCIPIATTSSPPHVQSATSAQPAQPRVVGGIQEAQPTSETARYDGLPPYPSEPADPRAGVAGDQPVRWSDEQARYWKVRANAFPCTAAHDHCLLAEAWFTENDEHRARGALRSASLHVFGPNGPIAPANATNPFRGGPYTAYRTVPATRKNLVPGVLAVVFPRPHAHPDNGKHSIEKLWDIAAVESVDYELGTVKLQGHADTHLLSAARVVVMTWQVGGTVKIVGDTKRVPTGDVFVPQ